MLSLLVNCTGHKVTIEVKSHILFIKQMGQLIRLPFRNCSDWISYGSLAAYHTESCKKLIRNSIEQRPNVHWWEFTFYELCLPSQYPLILPTDQQIPQYLLICFMCVCPIMWDHSHIPTQLHASHALPENCIYISEHKSHLTHVIVHN